MSEPSFDAVCAKVRTKDGQIYFEMTDGTYWQISTRDFGKKRTKTQSPWIKLEEKPEALK